MTTLKNRFRDEKMKVVFLDEKSVNWQDDVDLQALKKSAMYKSYSQTVVKDIVKRAKSAEVVITNKVPLRENEILQLKNLKMICVAATGYNHIDIKAAKKHGVAVAHVRGYATTSVAEQALLFILNFFHRFLEHDKAVKEKLWQKSLVFCETRYPYQEAKGKTLGIIGYGQIGKAIAKRAKAFGMNVLIAKLPGRKYEEKNNRVSLYRVLKKSDVISLSCPLTEQTRHLINEKNIQQIKPDALLINLARGAVVDEEAVVWALEKNIFKLYATDVFSQEPPPPNHPLLNKRLQTKVLFSPHIAWGSLEARQRLVDEMTKNIIAFQKGKKRNRIV